MSSEQRTARETLIEVIKRVGGMADSRRGFNIHTRWRAFEITVDDGWDRRQA
jgi:hypothetical protein